MKTLVVHPKDSSTDFLKPIYATIRNKTMVTGGVAPQELKKLINKHDRVMMMGHGLNQGLLSMGQFPETNAFVIDCSHVEALRKKEDNVFIWCYASRFVYNHDLEGFYSGMFISEAREALQCGVDATIKQVEESNYEFSAIVSKHISLPSTELLKKVSEEYREIASRNPIAAYNLGLLGSKTQSTPLSEDNVMEFLLGPKSNWASMDEFFD